MLCACHRRSRASLHRLSFSMTCISWPVRLCSAADCSSAAATAPARGAVKCVDKKKGRSNGSFSLRPLSSLDSFCVRQSDSIRSARRCDDSLETRVVCNRLDCHYIARTKQNRGRSPDATATSTRSHKRSNAQRKANRPHTPSTMYTAGHGPWTWRHGHGVTRGRECKCYNHQPEATSPPLEFADSACLRFTSLKWFRTFSAIIAGVC